MSKTLEGNPKTVTLNGNKVLFRVLNPLYKEEKPLIILSSTFHTYQDLNSTINYLSKVYPVIFVDLPDFGENFQNKMMNFTELADLFYEFCDYMNLKDFHLMGLSDSSYVCHYFSSKTPEFVDKLILQGFCSNLRPSVRILLNDHLKELEKSNFEEFVSGMLLTLRNYTKKYRIHLFSDGVKRLKARFESFYQSDRLKVLQNALERIIDHGELPPVKRVKTLLISGEWDQFSSAYDHFLVSKKFENVRLTILDHEDHFFNYSTGELLPLMTLRFLLKKDLSTIKGVRLYREKVFPIAKRTLLPRAQVDVMAYVDAGNGVNVPINVMDINAGGCQLFTIFNKHKTLKNQKLILKIERPGKDDLEMNLLIFKHSYKGTFKGVFSHRDVSKIDEIEAYIQQKEFEMNMQRAV